MVDWCDEDVGGRWSKRKGEFVGWQALGDVGKRTVLAGIRGSRMRRARAGERRSHARNQRALGNAHEGSESGGRVDAAAGGAARGEARGELLAG